MKYEAPQIIPFIATRALQATHPTFKAPTNPLTENSSGQNDVILAYADWE